MKAEVDPRGRAGGRGWKEWMMEGWKEGRKREREGEPELEMGN